MLRILTDLLESLQGQKLRGGSASAPHTLEVATAVLLVEVMRADGKTGEAECTAVAAALRSKFSLGEQELTELLELARERSENSHDLYSFTERLNEAFDVPQRIRIFELLWTVAYADGHADAHEAHLIRRLADLLHIRPGDAVAAKDRAESSSQ
ncbi:MAG: TerB family tellurite resistance protein [Steroidobacteraceae bacterium]